MSENHGHSGLLVFTVVALLLGGAYVFWSLQTQELAEQGLQNAEAAANALMSTETSHVSVRDAQKANLNEQAAAFLSYIQNWLTYTNNGKSILPHISFMYPPDWTVNVDYGTSTGEQRIIYKVTVTSPNGTDAISYGPGVENINCNKVLHNSDPENTVCKEIEGIPFMLTYTNSEAKEIYETVLKTFH